MAGCIISSLARPVADFKSSRWGDTFLHYKPDHVAIQAQEELARELKVELDKEMLSLKQKSILEQLHLIDSIDRLDLFYHFEKDIEDALKCIYERLDIYNDDLYLASLSFRILRQHGFNVSCDVFKGLVHSNGSLKEEENTDVQGLLSLYEACHLGVHGENIILDEVLVFTANKLKHFMQDDTLSHEIKEQVSHSLENPLHKRVKQLESLYYMKVYEQDPTHNKKLLRFAKICFNLMQSSHKEQLCGILRWWESIGRNGRLPIRDRLVECYVWGIAFHEPKYPLGRKMGTLAAQIMTSLDDVYDSCGTIDELELFTEAIERWDKSCLKQLPEDYRRVCKTLIFDVFDELERDLAAKGRSEYLDYAKKEIKSVCRSYFVDATWKKKKYIPSFDEYMETIAVRGTDMIPQAVFMWVDMEMANHEEFKWICSVPKPIQSMCLLLRTLNDICTTKVDRDKGDLPFLIVSYMKQYNVSYEEACEVLSHKTQGLWKDFNEALMSPTVVPRPLLMCMLNLCRLVEYTYLGGVDSFTSVNKRFVEDIQRLFVHSVPM